MRLVSVKNERRLINHLAAGYAATVERWLSVGAVAMPVEAQRDFGAEMIRLWREAIQAGAKFPVEQAKAAFRGLSTKETDPFEEFVREFINRFGARAIKGLIDTSLDQIRGFVERGIAEGKTLEQIAKEIREAIPSLSRLRAHVIARTETHTAAMYAAHETAKTADVPLTKKWVAGHDHRVRDFGEGDGVVDQFSHRAMSGVVVDMDEVFMVPMKTGGKEAMMYPGDPNGSAGNLINCRCVAVHRVKSYI